MFVVLASSGLVGLTAPIQPREPKELATLRGYKSCVASVTFSPDSRMLAGASWDGTVKLWDVANGKNVATLEKHDGHAECVAFSPDGKTLASGDAGGNIRLWDMVSYKQTVAFRGHANSVACIVFSSEGATLASASLEGRVKLWDVGTSREKSCLTSDKHQFWTSSLAYTPKGKLLAVDLSTTVWDVDAGKKATIPEGHRWQPMGFAFNPDATILASAGGTDETLKLWDVSTGKNLASFTLPGQVDCVAFSPDGKTLATGFKPTGHPNDGTVRLLDVSTRKEIATLAGHTRAIFCVAFSPDGRTLASGGVDSTIKLWSIPVR